jgi:hypothetical protein
MLLVLPQSFLFSFIGILLSAAGLILVACNRRFAKYLFGTRKDNVDSFDRSLDRQNTVILGAILLACGLLTVYISSF